MACLEGECREGECREGECRGIPPFALLRMGHPGLVELWWYPTFLLRAAQGQDGVPGELSERVAWVHLNFVCDCESFVCDGEKPGAS
jgi:hypothetical protein